MLCELLSGLLICAKYNDFTVGDTIELEKRENIKRETEAQINVYNDKLRHIDSKEKRL